MPYGLTNAGATYQRMIDMCLAGLPTDRVLAYMDDIVIFNNTFAEHMHDLKAVFSCLQTANVSLKPSKCIFAADRVNFLGFELSINGIQPQARLTDAIRQFQSPKSKKELKRFLGMAGFYRDFIRDFATISEPLNKLTCDNVPYTWSNECESAFNNLKQQLISRPVLAFPQLGSPFVVEVDASDYAAGGVLSQLSDDNTLHPVAYFSTAFKGSQRNWAAISKEAFALVLAIRHWHVYLAGTSFVLNSDHNPLVHLRKQKDPTGKFARWISELEEYNYTVKYIRGKDNAKADLLSRNEFASSDQPDSLFDNKIYATAVDNASFIEQLQTEQTADPLISQTIHLILQGQRITKGRYKRIQNQLRLENDILTKSGRPVVPASLRKMILSEIHCTAHFGIDKTYKLLKDRFYWPNMYASCTAFVSNCLICQQTKSDTAPPKAPLLPMATPEAPMQFIAIDIAFMPRDNQGYQYFLLIGDIFSKYIEAVPLKDQTATTITGALLSKWIYVHGTPYFLLSDQGSNVSGEIINDLCNVLGIEKRRSSAYHSQGNGFAERSIRRIKDMLRSALLQRKTNQNKWASVLPELVFALNTVPSKATNCVPYNVIFGRPPRLPIDALFNHQQRKTAVDISTAADYADERNFVLQDVFDVVFTNLQLNKEKMQQQYNKSLRFFDHQPGEKVWLKVKFYKTGENRKLAPRRQGPWTILRKLPNGVNFEIINDNTQETKVVHHDRLTVFKQGEGNVLLPPKQKQVSNPVKKNTDNSDSTDTEYLSSEESYESDSSVYESDENSDPDTGDEAPVENQRRYPRRERRARQFEDRVPWTSIHL